MLISDNYVCNNNNKLLHVSVTFIAYPHSVYFQTKKKENRAAGSQHFIIKVCTLKFQHKFKMVENLLFMAITFV